MIIEFMGLPGVGKSYLGKQVEKELSYRGFKGVSVVERSRSIISWKILSKCLRVIIQTTPKYKELKDRLVKKANLYISIQPKYNENSVSLVDYIEQIVFLDYVYTKLQLSKTIYLFDEGIAQQFANIVVNFGVDTETIQGMLSCLRDKPKTVYLTYSIEKIKNSIRSRNRHVCYIDELKGKELDRFLMDYQGACHSISGIVNPIIINREDGSQVYLDKVVQATIG